MRKLLTIAAVVLVVTLLAAPSLAQVVANDAYMVSYVNLSFTQFDAAVQLRIINTGQIGSPIDPATKQGTVCADIYAFDTNQEMFSCCSCPITANGLVSVRAGQPLTGVFPATNVVKIVADQGCDETSITTPVNGGLRAWFTSVETTPVLTLIEHAFESAPLKSQEQQFLGQACSFVHYLGSGRGRCSCFVDPATYAE